MKKLKIIILIITVIFSIGCEDFLEKEYDASLSEDKVFTNERLTRQFLVNIYNSLPDGLGIYSDPQFLGASRDVLTDNAQTSWNLHVYNRMNQCAYTSADNPLGYFWSLYLAGIRKANKFLENSHRAGIPNNVVPGDDNRLLDRFNAEARLLRAIFHFELLRYFGDIPIITKTFSMDKPEEMNMERTPAAEALKWIADECDAVKDILPFNWESPGNWGRVNGATAYALKSRALLYRASKFYNPTEKKEWWEEAAQAALDFINKNNQQVKKFELYKGDGANSYGAMFYKNPTTINEFILCRSVWYTTMIDEAHIPPGFPGGAGRVNPTQNFVDAFECIDGKSIKESPLYNPTKPYENRDPRFYMIVFYNGSIWGNPTPRPLEIYEGGKDITATAGTLTGYYLKKWCSPEINYTDPTPQGRAWILFRYAEILLNYAEAKNEALDAPDQSVYDAINQVRERAGMPPLPTGLTKEQMRERIRNERRIELCFEEHRYFDVRRWRLWDIPEWREEMINIRRVRVEKVGNSFNYIFETPEALKRKWFDKMYLFPIPYDQTLKAPKLGQNPGW